MNRTSLYTLDYYDKQVVQMIIDRQGLDPLQAIRLFITSKTHEMLEDNDCALWQFGAPAVYDICKAEQETGDPQSSVYLQGN